MSPRTLLPLLLTVVVSACVENTAPGNDREASLDPPRPAAEVASADVALSGVATEILYPEDMTAADRRAAPGEGEGCAFRFTRVGLPVFLYGADTGVIKLNGKLIPLPGRGDDAYEEGGVRVSVRPLDDPEGDEPFPAELVLRFQEAPNELGFHGFSGC